MTFNELLIFNEIFRYFPFSYITLSIKLFFETIYVFYSGLYRIIVL